jgi:hypothetical protein
LGDILTSIEFGSTWTNLLIGRGIANSAEDFLPDIRSISFCLVICRIISYNISLEPSNELGLDILEMTIRIIIDVDAQRLVWTKWLIFQLLGSLIIMHC